MEEERPVQSITSNFSVFTGLLLDNCFEPT